MLKSTYGVLRIFNETDNNSMSLFIILMSAQRKIGKTSRFLQSHLAVFTNVELIDENNNLLNSNNILINMTEIDTSYLKILS